MESAVKAKARDVLPQPSEKQIQQGAKKVLRDLGYWYVDTSQPYRAAITPGLADLIVFGHGRIVFMECKTKTGKLSSDQMSFRAHVENNGGEYIIVRSSADVVKWAEHRRSA